MRWAHPSGGCLHALLLQGQRGALPEGGGDGAAPSLSHPQFGLLLPFVEDTVINEDQASLAEERHVRWFDALVKFVHMRPCTLSEDVSALFYSRADKKCFQREAKMEPTPSLSPWRVRWADTMVESVHMRPRTLPEVISTLFYSGAEEEHLQREAEMEPTPPQSPP